MLADSRVMLYEEVNKIHNPVLRDITIRHIDNSPKWFWTARSSSTGKYHSADNQLQSGLVIHTVKTIWLACRLARAYDINEDMVRSAAATHDTYKFGTGDTMELGKDRPQYQQHGMIAAEIFWSTFKEYVPKGVTRDELTPTVKAICSAVRSHMGRWGKHKPRHKLDYLLHYADMCASDEHMVGQPWIADVCMSNGRRN